ncbi:MAG: PadR family transcriptional regulator [Dehalococcoidia bacterium]|nr:PadR family transcriptional regulator [Dehalococcoidia bacterium]MDD5493476.1 PadR family transcriptional regulator [Dehalococcoidia bacterium]
MSLKYPLLGFLSYEPSTGYQLTKRFFKPIRPVRAVVYRYLNLMLDEGLVEVERVEQEKFPAKNVFSITQKGRDVLTEWLTTFSNDKFRNDGLSVILWYSALVNKETTLMLLNKFARNVQQEYVYYRQESQKYTKSRKDSPSEFDYMYKSLVYDFILSRYRDTLSFVEKAIRVITDFNENAIKKSLDSQDLDRRRNEKTRGRKIEKQ